MWVVERCDGERQGCFGAAMEKKLAMGHELVDYMGHLLGCPFAEKRIPVTPLTDLDRWIEDGQEGKVVFRCPSLAYLF